MIRSAVDLIRRHRPRTIAIPYWDDRHPDHVAASQVLRTAMFTSGLRALRDRTPTRGGPTGSATTSSTTARRRRSSSTSRTHYERKRDGARLLSQPVRAGGDGAVPTRLTAPTFRQLIESRDAQFGALAGVAFAEGDRRPRADRRVRAAEGRAMNIGMVCYASVGGSGVVATELAHALADRGHQVHLISSEPPFRWRRGVPGLSFDAGRGPAVSAVSRAAISARADQHHRARRAKSSGSTSCTRTTRCRTRRRRISPSRCSTSAPAAVPPRTVTTLHGTDITLVGSDPSYARAVAFSIEQSHGVTAVSQSLQDATPSSALGIRARHHGDSEFSRLRGVPAAAGSRRCARGSARPTVRRPGHSRLELPAGQARRRRVRGLSPIRQRVPREVRARRRRPGS